MDKQNGSNTEKNSWQLLFERWPAQFPKHGILVTTFGELIPFINFMLSPSAVIVERDKPDSSDARKVILDYRAIDALKLTTPGELSQFQQLGFQPVQNRNENRPERHHPRERREVPRKRPPGES